MDKQFSEFGFFVDFMRANGDLGIEDKEQEGLFSVAQTCWTLYGENILTSDSEHSKDDVSEFKACGPPIDGDRIYAVAVNLYREHCPVE